MIKMDKDSLSFHCSVKSVRLLKRKKHPDSFKGIKDAINELNAIFSEMCEDFLIEDDKMMRVNRKKIKQINEEPEDKDGVSAVREKGAKITQGSLICNFFIIPTDRLRVFDMHEQKYEEVGLSIKVYSRVNKKVYKCISLDLLNETLANSKWIDPNFLDYDFYLYKESLYPLLLRALRLSTRLLDDDDAKTIFDTEIGWVDDLYRKEDESGYYYLKDNRYVLWSEPEGVKIAIEPLTLKAVVFLKALQEVIEKSNFLEMGDKSKLQEGFIGWEDESKWAIEPGIVEADVKKMIKRTGRNFEIDKDLFVFLYDHGVLEMKEESRSLRSKTKFGNGNKRAYVFDKSRFCEYLIENENIPL